MSNNLLSLVGLAKKAGKLEIGDEPVGTVARSGHAKLIIVASDAADNTGRRASHFADAGHVKWLTIPFTKAELGSVLGRTSCAMAAFTDAGFAAALVTKLAVLDPEQYGDAAGQLEAKAQKVLQRQKEQRVHEKRLKEGKSKPWSQARDVSAGTSPLRSKAAPSGREPVPPGCPPPRSERVKGATTDRPRGKITVKKK